MKLKGAHKQAEMCVDIRYFLQRLIELESKNLIDRTDKLRLKVLVKKISHSYWFKVTSEENSLRFI